MVATTVLTLIVLPVQFIHDEYAVLLEGWLNVKSVVIFVISKVRLQKLNSILKARFVSV